MRERKITNVLKMLVAALLAASLLSSCGFGSLDALKPATQDETTATTTAANTDEPVETQAAETTQSETAPTAGAETTTVKVSSSWESFQFGVFGDTYQLPMPYSQFAAMGWKLDSSSNISTIQANSIDFAYFYKNNIKMHVCFKNYDVSQRDYKECFVMEVDYEYAEGNMTAFTLPGGITVGKSTYDDVFAAYGSNSQRVEFSSYYGLYYYLSDISSGHMIVFLDKETNIVIKVELEHDVAPAESTTSKVNSTPLYNYQKPASQSTNPDDAVFSYDGVLYKLPCPVSEFLRNGWTLKEGDKTPDTVVAGNSTAYIDLEYKNDYTRDYEKRETRFDLWLSVFANNTSPDANILKNCVIKEITFSTDYSQTIPTFKTRIGFCFPISTKAEIERVKLEKNLSLDYSSRTKDGDIYEEYEYKSSDKNVQYTFSYFNGDLFSFTIGAKK